MGYWIILIIAGFMAINKTLALLKAWQDPDWLRQKRLEAGVGGLLEELNMFKHTVIQIIWIAAFGYAAYQAYNEIYGG